MICSIDTVVFQRLYMSSFQIDFIFRFYPNLLKIIINQDHNKFIVHNKKQLR